MRTLTSFVAVTATAALLAACGGSSSPGGTTSTAVNGANAASASVSLHTNTTKAPPPKAPPQSNAAHSALAAFASCMRAHGEPLPSPSRGGSGPIFNTHGIDTTTKRYRAAATACRHTLTGLLQPKSTSAKR